VFPSARDRTKPLTEHAIVNLWKRIAVKAGMPPNERYGWHSFRRAFANALRDVPLRDLKDLGGWKSARTVVEIYQQGSEGAQRRALAALDGPAPASSGGTETHERAHGTGTEGR
jgi:integrase